MPCHQQARHDGGKRQLDDHHPVYGGGGQHHDGPQGRLDEAKARDAEPRRHASPRMAKALTIMPET